MACGLADFAGKVKLLPTLRALAPPLIGACMAVALWLVPATAAVDKAGLEKQFQRWIETEIRPEAVKAGVSKATFDSAFAGVKLDWTLPELAPPGAPPPSTEAQAEFRGPAAYFRESGLAALTKQGQARLAQWKKTLTAIEARFHVPRNVLVAVWARESNFGTAALPYRAVPALATGAFIGRRKESFRSELIAALKILEAGDVTPAAMLGSWAGAIGQPQILPSQYLDDAVDFDRDGWRDVWNSVPDSLATIANFLIKEGWDPKRAWGFEAVVPASVACSLEGPDQGKPLRDWAKLGVTRADGGAIPASASISYLMMPAGRLGPAFLVSRNFYTLKAYNNSDLYALYILHLSDRLDGAGPFKAPWKEADRFPRARVAALQKALEKRGHDVGGADGLIGFKTRIAIGKEQAATGRPVTCQPDQAMMRGLP